MPRPIIKGGQGLPPASLTVLDDGVYNALLSGPRFEHDEAAHVLGAAPLGHEADFEFIAGHDLGVDDGRGVVSRVEASGKRMGHHGFAQVALFIALPDALGDGSIEVAAGKVHVLADVEEDHGGAAVLAEGQAFGLRQLGVLQQPVEGLFPDGGTLALAGFFECRQHVFAKLKVSLLSQPGDGLRDFLYVEFLSWRGIILA